MENLYQTLVCLPISIPPPSDDQQYLVKFTDRVNYQIYTGFFINTHLNYPIQWWAKLP